MKRVVYAGLSALLLLGGLTVAVVLDLTLLPLAGFLLPLIVWLFCKFCGVAKQYVTFYRTLFVSVTLSAWLLCIPYYVNVFTPQVPEGEEAVTNWGSAIFMSFQHALRLFALDGDFYQVLEFVQSNDSIVSPFWHVVGGAVLCVLAPLLTFTLLLSFIKNFAAKFNYTVHFFRRVHIFSELNEKSLALAKSLIDYPADDLDNATVKISAEKKDAEDEGDAPALEFNLDDFTDIESPTIFRKKIATATETKAHKWRRRLPPLIVFTDVLDKHEEEHYELVAEAKEINAILFRKDLASIRFRVPFMFWRKLSFYLISEDEPEKIRHAKHVMKKYNDERTKLFVFSDNIEMQLLMDSLSEQSRLYTRRINDIQSLIYHNLDLHGLRLFQNAYAYRVATEKDTSPAPDSRAVITAVIVGLGQYGLEMLKALLWYCQMVGFRLVIHAFDEREDAASRLYALCPELKKPSKSEKKTEKNEWEDDYYPTIHGGIAVDSDEFVAKLREIPNATYVFVGLGSDELNISTAIHIRTLYEQLHRRPDIETVVYDSNIRKKMSCPWDEEEKREQDADRENEQNEANRQSTKGNALKKKKNKKPEQEPKKRKKLAPQKDAEEKKYGIVNCSDQPYNIHMTGDLESFYSAKTLLRSDLEEAGKFCELRWTFSSLLGKLDEREVLQQARDYAQKTEDFDPDKKLILFEKQPNQEKRTLEEHSHPSHICIEGLYKAARSESTACDNIDHERCVALCKLLDEQALEVLKKKAEPAKKEQPEKEQPEPKLPENPLERFALLRQGDRTVFIYEDPVSGDLQFYSARHDDPNDESEYFDEDTFNGKIAALEEKIRAYLKELYERKPIGYYQREYNHHASLTRAVREYLRQSLLLSNDTKIKFLPGGGWTEQEIKILQEGLRLPIRKRTWEQMEKIGKLEHTAWNAYMRTEGYSRGYEKKSNHLAKQHNCLKPVTALDAKQLRKDA